MSHPKWCFSSLNIKICSLLYIMSVKKNFAYSSILTLSGYIFPLITYPYVSRVLGVTNIGTVNYIESIISYFCMFSTMGIATFGIREIAACKEDRTKLSNVFSSILFLNFLSTILVLIVLVLSILLIPQFSEYREMLYIGSFRLICSMLLIEWLFTGLEDFAYITKRSLIVKCLFVVSVFLFIHTSEDYLIYYILLIGMSSCNAIFNIVHSRNYVSFSLSNINIKVYLAPFFTIGLYRLITSMYSSFNITWLGLSTNPTEVGYYTTATKLQILILAVFTALTNVMLPRMASLLSEHNYDEFKEKIGKSTDALFAFSFPIVVLFFVYGPIILHVLAGGGYEGSYTPFRVIIPLIVIIGYEQIIVLQILMPMKKDRAILYNSIVGAVVGVLLNYFLVNLFGATGSAIVWLLSEFAVLISAQLWVKKYIGMGFPFRYLLKYILYFTPLFLVLYVLETMTTPINEILSLFLGCLLCTIYTIIIQVKYIKNEFLSQLMNKYVIVVSSKLNRNNER